MQKITYIPEVNYSPEIHRKISRIVGMELSSLGGACYYPKMINYYNDLKDSLKITSVEIAEFKKQNIHK